MTLYHFTSSHHMPKIAMEGITKGVVPWSIKPNGQVGMAPGFQWLTTKNEWAQEWARPSPFSKLPYRRDEFRISIAIPARQLHNLRTWDEMCRRQRPDSAEYMETFADLKYWRLFVGRIPPSWFLQVDRNPTRHDLVITDQN